MKKQLSLILTLLLPFGYASAQTTVPKLVNYQGTLTYANGQPLTNGTYKIRFDLYDHPSNSSNLIWGTTNLTAVVGGQFNVVLGAASGAPVSGAAVNDIGFAFSGGDRFLQMTVLTDSSGSNNLATPLQLLPRQQILSAPYALRAFHGVPAGTILAYGGTNAPEGFLMCAGQSLGRADYAELFKAIGTAFGSIDANTFNLPDFRGRFLRGSDDPDGNFGAYASANNDPDGTSRIPMAAGGNAGRNVGSVQSGATARPTRPFTYSGTTSSSGSHSHDIVGPYSSSEGGDGRVSVLTDDQVAATIDFPINTSVNGAHTHTYSGSISAGGDNESRPLNVYVNYIIKY